MASDTRLKKGKQKIGRFISGCVSRFYIVTRCVCWKTLWKSSICVRYRTQEMLHYWKFDMKRSHRHRLYQWIRILLHLSCMSGDPPTRDYISESKFITTYYRTMFIVHCEEHLQQCRTCATGDLHKVIWWQKINMADIGLASGHLSLIQVT